MNDTLSRNNNKQEHSTNDCERFTILCLMPFNSVGIRLAADVSVNFSAVPPLRSSAKVNDDA